MARFLFLTFGPGTDDNKSEIRRGAARTEFIFSTEDALAPAIAHGEKPEQIAERGDEGGDVGEGGGVEHTVYARDLTPGCTIPICCKIILARREASNSTGSVIN